MTKIIEHQHQTGRYALKFKDTVYPIDNEVAEYIVLLEHEYGERSLSWTEQLLLANPSTEKLLTEGLS